MGWLKGRRLWLLASLVLLATLISNLPAQLVWRQVQPHLPVKVELDGLTGTLWRGSLARLQVDGIDQGALEWRWQPAGLLAGELELDLDWRPRDGRVQAVLRMAVDRLSLDLLYCFDSESSTYFVWVARTCVTPPVPIIHLPIHSTHTSQPHAHTP